MDLLGQSVFLLGAHGEDFTLARDETVFTVEPGSARASLRGEGEKARQSATEFLGGEGLLDHRVAALIRAVGLLGSLKVVPHEQHLDFGTHATHATRQLEATHALHVGTGDQRIDLELRRPAESLAGGAIGGVEHAVPLVAEGAEKRNAVLGVVVDQEHAEGALGGRRRLSHEPKSRMPGHFGRVRSEQRLADGRGARVCRPHHRHRGVGPCTGGTSEAGSVEIQKIGPVSFGGTGAGSGFQGGAGPFVSSFRSSTSHPSLLDRRWAIQRTPS